MNDPSLRVLAGVVALSGALATVAASADPAAPVTINTCGPILNPVNAPTAPPLINGLSLTSTSSGIAITFVNESSKTANLVNFAVDSNGRRFVVRDVGTFSPGISIAHTYRNGAGQAFVLPEFIAPNVKCAVASVRFVDGTVWRPGQASVAPMDAPPAPQAPLASATLRAYPARLDIDRIAESELFLVQSTRRVEAFRETDDCAGIANVVVAATAESSATYSVKPIAGGACTAKIVDETGDTLAYPIVVR